MKDRTILLVEDEPDDEALTLRALRKAHITNEVIVARDGAEALGYLFGAGTSQGVETPVAPAVILLDLNLPKLNGLEVLRRLRRDPRTEVVPVVILTSSREEQDLTAGYKLGANSYVTKPVDFVQFSNAVTQLGQYWLRLNEPPPRK